MSSRKHFKVGDRVRVLTVPEDFAEWLGREAVVSAVDWRRSSLPYAIRSDNDLIWVATFEIEAVEAGDAR